MSMLNQSRRMTAVNCSGILSSKTNRFVKYNKPDIVVIEKQNKELIIIEGSNPGDMN